MSENDLYLNLILIKKSLILFTLEIQYYIQKDPWKFIVKQFLNSKHLILRLRTRNKGETMLNLNTVLPVGAKEKWVPYIVLIIMSLIQYLKYNF